MVGAGVRGAFVIFCRCRFIFFSHRFLVSPPLLHHYSRAADPVMGVPKPGEDLWSAAYVEHRALVAGHLLRAPAPAAATDAADDAPSCSDATGTGTGGTGAGRAGAGTGAGTGAETRAGTGGTGAGVSPSTAPAPAAPGDRPNASSLAGAAAAGSSSDGGRGGVSDGGGGGGGDKAAADEAFRAGLARLEAGDARGALAMFRVAHAACPR